MSAIKKTTTKSKSPAPATKLAPPVEAQPATAPAAKPSPAKKKPAAAAPAQPVIAVAPAPAVEPVSLAVAALSLATTPKPVAAKPLVTTITACIDVGFGNSLFVRGEGPGLSWETGVPMHCVSADQWQIALGESARPFAVKFLINDVTWCTGPDYIVASGSSMTLAPQF